MLMKNIFKKFRLLLVAAALIFICFFYVGIKNQNNTVVGEKNKTNTRSSKSNEGTHRYKTIIYSICDNHLRRKLAQLSKFGYGHSSRPNVLYNSLGKYSGSIVKDFIIQTHPDQLKTIVNCYRIDGYTGVHKDFVRKVIDIYGD